ncbi:hypothetical protein ABZ930_08110 [Streptomyces sp. NPDC046716]|uniref:hypothetical protein n=1 Tax=Streptomyces sp. NPDC046716 TaxID=3157093 RepID=UPI00340682D2
MAAGDDALDPGAPVHRVQMSLEELEEAAWLYPVDEVCLEDLPMTAAEALAAGVDTPTLRELAGLSRRADSQDIRDAFEQALTELGIALPDPALARRYALHRLATGFAAGDVALTELASDTWWEMEAATAEEHAFVALLRTCACCTAYTLGLDEEAWTSQLRFAARALASHPTVGPGY